MLPFRLSAMKDMGFCNKKKDINHAENLSSKGAEDLKKTLFLERFF